MTLLKRYCHILSLIISLFIYTPPTQSYAQITLDGTMGSSGSLSGPDYLITDGMGTIFGLNLFHSFGVFNLFNNESATFTGPNSIGNIISRVTGGSSSFIDGLLRSDIAGANMYFLNPAGVMFGQNATLDVSGSFHATTADYVSLSDGGIFDATNPSNSVLTSAPPSAFGFLGGSPSGITVDGSLLKVPDGETLSLTGGDIQINDGNLSAPEGEINVVSAASGGEVGFASAPVVDSFTKLGTIDVKDSIIDVSGEGAGTIYIRGDGFVMDGGQVIANSTGDKDGGGIDIHLTNDFEAKNTSSVKAEAFDDGDAGNILLEIGNLSLTESNIFTRTNSSGNAGNISIRASNIVSLSDSSIFSTSFGNIGDGAVGNISIDTGNLSLANSNISSDTFSSGRAGDITIKATDTISLTDGSFISSSSSEDSGHGDAGNISMETGSLSLTDSNIFSSTFSSGKAGKIEIKALDTISLTDGSLISSSSIGSFGDGDAGNMSIETGNLSLADSSIFSTAFSSGRAGDITITAIDTISLTDGSFTSSDSLGDGDAGNTSIETGDMSLTDSSISSSTSSSGKAGEITIKAIDTISLTDGSFITNDTFGDGDAGDFISIETASLTLADNSGISSRTGSSGKAGKINITAIDTISLSDNSSISTTSLGISGDTDTDTDTDTGNITLDTGNLSLANASFISSATSSFHKAGDITITALDTISFTDGSYISSSSVGDSGEDGAAGNVMIETVNISLTNKSYIESITSSSGKAGKITITALDTISLTDHCFISNLSFGDGAAGDIELNTGNLSLTNASRINSDSGSSGKAGKITIKALDTISLTDGSDIRSASFGTFGDGTAGNIELNTGNLSLANASIISTRTLTSKNAGTIKIMARDSVLLTTDSLVESTTRSSGHAGKIFVDAENLSLANTSQILTTTFSSGDAGEIHLKTKNLSLKNSFSEIDSSTFSTGAAGNIIVDTENLSLANTSIIQTGTGSIGNAGTVSIDTVNLSLANNSHILSNAGSEGKAGIVKIKSSGTLALDGHSSIQSSYLLGFGKGFGDANKVELDVGNLILTDHSIIGTKNEGQGEGGDITISANNVFSYDSSITATNTGIGDAGNITIGIGDLLISENGDVATSANDGTGGNITINGNDIQLLNGSGITARVSKGKGSGGNVTMNVDTLVALDDSDITANANEGFGGNITINAKAVFFSDDIDLDASSNVSGRDGTVQINSPAINISGDLVALPERFLDVEEILPASCETLTEDKESSFIILGKESMPLKPDELLPGL